MSQYNSKGEDISDSIIISKSTIKHPPKIGLKPSVSIYQYLSKNN
jgi:hypothetical protein